MTLNLKDPTLLRQQCYIDGQWLDARSGGSKPVTNPANGEVADAEPAPDECEHACNRHRKDRLVKRLRIVELHQHDGSDHDQQQPHHDGPLISSRPGIGR